MYISGGHFRRRRLHSLEKAHATRPTSGRARAAWINILLHRFSAIGFSIEGTSVLDLFAGTGALGLELLSRGAHHVTFIEKNVAALQVLRRNIASLGVQGSTTVLAGNVYDTLHSSHPVPLIVMDPPYQLGPDIPPLMALLAKKGWCCPGAILAAETDASQALACPEDFDFLLERSYGKPKISFFMYNP